MKTGPIEFDGTRYRRASAHQKAWGSRIISELSLQGDERVLDVGCGDGVLTAQLADLVPNGHVVGLDPSLGMIETARTFQRDNLTFVLQDILDCQYADEFDVIFSNAALHWVHDHRPLLEVCHKALKASGVLRANFGADGNCESFFQIARELIAGEFRDAFEDFEWPYYMPTLSSYEDLIGKSSFSQSRIWGEEADRSFPNHASMLAWLAQPSIVPFKQHLDEATAERFHQEVASRLTEVSLQGDGTCFIAFRRINILARK